VRSNASDQTDKIGFVTSLNTANALGFTIAQNGARHLLMAEHNKGLVEALGSALMRAPDAEPVAARDESFRQ